ncbi:MAG TPA: deoxyribodipyrimidine photo-lyase [Opitutaceae bacterium]|nr:deoxyribodipyrimidine photo-lyase [Opitutaceae bacterium]
MVTSPGPAIVWFRSDLRLQDNHALAAAVSLSVPVLPVFILDDEGEGKWRAGGASRWWLHHSLTQFDLALRKIGSRLVIRRGDSLENLMDLLKMTRATAVFWNRCYEPRAIARDARIKTELSKIGRRSEEL